MERREDMNKRTPTMQAKYFAGLDGGIVPQIDEANPRRSVQLERFRRHPHPCVVDASVDVTFSRKDCQLPARGDQDRM